jgi:hypothetical protein
MPINLKAIRWICAAGLWTGLNSCLPDDEKITLPPPGELTTAEADLGGTYAWQVYYNLATGESLRVQARRYDLAFECAPQGRRVFLNFANVARAVLTGYDDFALAVRPADYPDSLYNADTSDGKKLALDSWDAHPERRPVFLLHRGDFQSDAAAGLYQKLQILRCDEKEWTFRYGPPDDTVGAIVTLAKDPQYAQILFSFENGVVREEPPLNGWHLLFSRYTFNFSEEAASADFKFYSVTGALINTLAGVKAAKITPQTPGYIPFDSLKGPDVARFPLTDARDAIGYDWKIYSFQSALYEIVPGVYFLVRTPGDDYYKLRFVGFYNAGGRKGAPQFEYQRL